METAAARYQSRLRLSAVAAFSKYHFHRQFTALFGLSAHRYVELSRMHRAAQELAFRDQLPITAIALASGYEAPRPSPARSGAAPGSRPPNSGAVRTGMRGWRPINR